jgi:hypothetical protein
MTKPPVPTIRAGIIGFSFGYTSWMNVIIPMISGRGRLIRYLPGVIPSLCSCFHAVAIYFD